MEQNQNELRPEADQICLEDLSSLFGFINQQGITHMGELCGGLAADLHRRVYVMPNGLKEIEGGDLLKIWSHDGDIRGSEAFFNALRKFMPEVNRDERKVLVGRHEIPMRRLTLDTTPPLIIEVMERMDPLDYNTAKALTFNPPFLSIEEQVRLLEANSAYPHVILQGVPCIEKPFGEEGPVVRVCDPLALLIAKAGALGSFTASHKIEKYERHMRVLALAIEPWLEAASRKYADGKLDRNPAIIANRLAMEIDVNCYNFSTIGSKRLGLLQKVCRHYGQGTDKTVYMSEDVMAA